MSDKRTFSVEIEFRSRMGERHSGSGTEHRMRAKTEDKSKDTLEGKVCKNCGCSILYLVQRATDYKWYDQYECIECHTTTSRGELEKQHNGIL
jgi:hypothetical protein